MRELAPIVITAAAAAALVGGIVLATSESAVDKERKPQLAEQIVQNSSDICTANAQEMDSLREALMNARSNSLDFILDQDITVCPDIRLSELDKGFFDTVPDGMLYPGSDPMITLRSDGEELGDYPASLLDEFKSAFEGRAADLRNPNTENQIGYAYWVSNGNGGFVAYEWDAAKDFKVIQKNPEINNKPQVSAPKPW